MMAVALPALLWFAISEQHSGKMPHCTRSIFVEIKNIIVSILPPLYKSHFNRENLSLLCEKAREEALLTSSRLCSGRRFLSLAAPSTALPHGGRRQRRRRANAPAGQQQQPAAAPGRGAESRRAAAPLRASPSARAPAPLPPALPSGALRKSRSGRSRARCHGGKAKRGGEETYPEPPAVPRGVPSLGCRGQAGQPQVVPPGAAPPPLTSVPGGKAPGSSLALRPLRADGRTDGRRLPAVPQAGDTGEGGGRRRGVARTAPPRPALRPSRGAGSGEEGARRQPRGQKPRAGRGQSSGAGPSSAGRRASSGMAGGGCPQRLALLLLLALPWPGRAAAEVSARDGTAARAPAGQSGAPRHRGSGGREGDARTCCAVKRCTAASRSTSRPRAAYLSIAPVPLPRTVLGRGSRTGAKQRFSRSRTRARPFSPLPVARGLPAALPGARGGCGAPRGRGALCGWGGPEGTARQRLSSAAPATALLQTRRGARFVARLWCTCITVGPFVLLQSLLSLSPLFGCNSSIGVAN